MKRYGSRLSQRTYLNKKGKVSMTISEQPIPKDPEGAATLLATLEVKDQDEAICRYPTCNALRQVASKSGRPSAYCDNTDHTAVSNHRARQQLRAAVAGGLSATVKTEQHASPVVPVESLRTSVVYGMQQLQANLERYLSVITTIADPDLSAAQIQATLDQAQARIAEAQQMISAERSLRLAAEIARTAAEAQAQEERDATESAIGRMEEMEAYSEQLKEEHEQHQRKIQAEYAALIERIRIETQHRIEEVEQQAREALARAQAATTVAQAEAKQADGRARAALAQAVTAERLVSDTRDALKREREEIDRLRKEHTQTIAELRERADVDRFDARDALKREREEITRLRTELSAVRKQAEQATTRADTLATTNDTLRGQLIQLQAKEQPTQK
jgi:colicin import membrane protein